MPDKIAIVDANKIECLKLQNVLQTGHYESVVLHSLDELDRWLGRARCRTIIIDLDSLPVDRTYFRNFRQQHPHISVLCMSQRQFHPELEEAIRENIFACVNKPVDPEEIGFLLKSVHENRVS